MRVRDIMSQLPNLDDLSLPWSYPERRDRALLGTGRVLRGRFGGKLELLRGCAGDPDVVDMLLEIPTGLHFTEVNIQNTHESLLCCDTRKCMRQDPREVLIHRRAPL